MNLPAYLQTGAKKLNETALLGIGASLPPHISIRGNAFTLVDATGAEQPAGPVLDVCIADLSDVVCKQFYADKWKPDSNEPPLCWSANGIGPSRESTQPQAATCAECPNNVRGSAVSQMSGAAIKACRDERWLALLIPSIPQVQFQLKLTPGSFKNWQAYVKTAEGSQTEISDVVTRLGFQAGVNGVLTFQAVSYIAEETAKLRNMAYEKKSFDVLVGRNDRPISGALPAPAAAPQIAPPAQQVQQPAPFGGAPAVATPSMPMAPSFPASPTPSAAPASPSEAPRRTRRTKAQIDADNAATQQTAQPAPQPEPAAPMAPFRPQAQQEQPAPAFAQPAAAPGPAFAAPAPAAAGASFGMQPGVAPNPELTQALGSLFGKQ